MNQEALKKHQDWLEKKEGGQRLVLDGTHLGHLNLRNANISCASMKHMYLVHSNFQGANISNVDFTGSVLNSSNLVDTIAHGANFSQTKLNGTDLGGIDAQNAIFVGANFSGANTGANKEGVDAKRGIYKNSKFDFDTIITLPPLILTGMHWNICITDEVMCIECERHKINDWETLKDEQIRVMCPGALDWWNSHKTLIMQIAKFHREKCGCM